MAIELTIRGTTIEFPENGEDPSWGENVSAWAQLVTDTLNLLIGPDDILQTSATIANDQTAPENIRGFFFNPETVRAANIAYSIYRETDSTSAVETGDILITYNENNAVDEKWQIIQRTNGTAGVVLTVSDTGQFSYTSSNMAGTNYSGVMKFAAKTLFS